MPTSRNSRGREKTPVFSNDNLALERVIGSTTKSNVAFAANPTKNEFATVAGCVTVVSALGSEGYVQEHFLQSGLNSITSVAYSPDGKYLAVGEKGKDPLVNVWDMSSDAPKLVRSINQHRFGVATLAFSASGSQLVTCGVQHDGMCHVWEVASFGSKNMEPKASVRVSVVIQSVAFYSEDAFITVGKRHLKFWFMEASDEGKISIEGRTAVLGAHRSSTFKQVEVVGDLCLAITEDGHLCTVAKHGAAAGKPRFQISNFIDLKAGNCFSLTATEKYAICGCSDGTLAVFDRESLEHVADMPRPAPLGATLAGEEAAVKAVYPDVIASRMTGDSSHLAAFFSDGTFRLWSLADISEATLVHESTSHSQAVWDVQVHPSGDSFATCSADNTIRFWNMAQIFNVEEQTVTARTTGATEQIGIIHTDPTFKQLLAEGMEEGEEGQSSIGGVRCVCFSPDLEHIASGDRAGNVRVHHLPTLKQVHYAAAHDSEVLSLSYCEAVKGVDGQLLATGSRDRLVHIFRENGATEGDQYELASTLDDHSSSITKVKFVTNEATGDVSLLSCSADKSLVFRSLTASEDTTGLVVDRYSNSQASGTVYDMDVDTRTNSVVFSGKDKKISIHSIVSGKANFPAQKTKKSTGDILKLALDTSGQYAATSSTDKGVRIYDLQAKAGKRSAYAECLAEAFATAEIMPAIAVVPTSSHVLTVSGGGCVFIWKISDAVREKMQQAMGAGPLEEALAAIKEGRSSLAAKDTVEEVEAPTSNAASVFEQFVAEAALPAWAQGADAQQPATEAFGVAAPASGSKWALDGGAMSLFSGDSIGAPGGHDFASIFGSGTSYDDRRLTIEPSQISETDASQEEAEEAQAAAEAEVAPIPEEAHVDDAFETAVTEVESEFVNFQAFSSFGSMAGMAKPRLSLSAAYRSEQKASPAEPEVVEAVEAVEAFTEERAPEESVDESVDEPVDEPVDEEVVDQSCDAVAETTEEEISPEASAEVPEEQEEEEVVVESKEAAALESTHTRLQELDEILGQQRTALELISDICDGQTFTEEDFKPRAIGDEELELLEEVEVDESADFLAKENEEKANFAYEVERTRKFLEEQGIDYSAPADKEQMSPSKKPTGFRRTPLKRLGRLNALATPRSATRRDHEHVLSNLRNAFNTAVRYYATLNTAVAEDMYVAEMGSNAILDDYENLFAEIDVKLPVKAAEESEDGEVIRTATKPLEVDQFPDMLVQLAQMLRTQQLA